MSIQGNAISIGGFEIHIAWVFVFMLVSAWLVGRAVAEYRGNRATEKWYKKYKNNLETAVLEKSQQYPWMAQQFADLLFMFDEQLALNLRWKSHPARKASEEVDAIAREKRALQKTNKMLEYQLEFYEKTFPWLEEFKEIDPQEAWDYVKGVRNEERKEYDNLKQWLSPEEYQNLSTAKRSQLALDRYCKRKKQVGKLELILKGTLATS